MDSRGDFGSCVKSLPQRRFSTGSSMTTIFVSLVLSRSATMRYRRRAESDRVQDELPSKQRLAVQTIRGSGFANGNSQGRLAEVFCAARFLPGRVRRIP